MNEQKWSVFSLWKNLSNKRSELVSMTDLIWVKIKSAIIPKPFIPNEQRCKKKIAQLLKSNLQHSEIARILFESINKKPLKYLSASDSMDFADIYLNQIRAQLTPSHFKINEEACKRKIIELAKKWPFKAIGQQLAESINNNPTIYLTPSSPERIASIVWEQIGSKITPSPYRPIESRCKSALTELINSGCSLSTLPQKLVQMIEKKPHYYIDPNSIPARKTEYKSTYNYNTGGRATLKGSIGHDDLNVRTRRNTEWRIHCKIIFSEKYKQSWKVAA